jgi:serine/threonine protein kinase
VRGFLATLVGVGAPEIRTPQHPTLTRLGSYEILRMLARGGMAEIYLARAVGPQGFEKLVVLKKILPHLAENPKFVRLFLDEAKLAAGLDHSNIAHVYDMGMADGNYFFTMEYVHGQDVRSILRRCAMTAQAMPLQHAVLIARNVASGLHHAHERRSADDVLLGIVHRDVSPSNILISYDGEVKLVDFGVAKAATSSTKTRTGTLKGKVAYMSPEQARGAPLDRRSDTYSLGIVLWEMVTGRRLYKGENDLQTIYQILHERPAPASHLRPDCAPQLEAIIERALAPAPEHRYRTAQELQLELEEFAREHKLAQSSVALSTYVQATFSEEITAWRVAQSSGITLTDHVVSTAGDPTSSDDRSDVDDVDQPEHHDDEDAEEPDDPSLPPARLPHGTTAPGRPAPARPTPPPAVEDEPASIAARVGPRRLPWILGIALLASGAVAVAVTWSGAGETPVPAPAPAPAPAAGVAPADPPAPTPAPVVEAAQADDRARDADDPSAVPAPIAPPLPVAGHATQPKSGRATSRTERRHRSRSSKRGPKPATTPGLRRDELPPLETKPPATDAAEPTKPKPKFDPNPFPPS